MRYVSLNPVLSVTLSSWNLQPILLLIMTTTGEPSMNSGILISIIKDLATTIDESLLPQTTISGLGLKLALRLKPRFEELIKPQADLQKHELFAQALEQIFTDELDCRLAVEPLQENGLRVKISHCPFRCTSLGSICLITQGIIGGFGFIAFGYCKINVINGPSTIQKPCCIDLYTMPTDEALDKTGFEYSKDNIILLKGDEDELAASQRQARRKMLLSLFTNLSLSLRNHCSANKLAQSFIEALSCLTEIEVAALYLKDTAKESFKLTAHFGLRQDVLPLVNELNDEPDYMRDSISDIVKVENATDWCELGVCLRIVKAFTTYKLKFEDRVVGLLNIGWKSSVPLGTEYSEALRSACTLLAAVIDNNRLYFELEKAYIDGIGLLGRLVNVVDRFVVDHSKRVAELSELIALEMGIPQEKASLLYEAGFLHDIGKISIPPEILVKPGKLTDEEFKLVQEHPATGVSILAPVTMYREILPAVRYHHERLDGSGYPEGLTNNEIPLFARIVAVADVYDAITSDRSYRNAAKEEDAVAVLISGKGTKFDPNVVNALVAVLDKESVKQRSIC